MNLCRDDSPPLELVQDGRIYDVAYSLHGLPPSSRSFPMRDALIDEIPDPKHLRLELRVIGEQRQGSDTSQLLFSARELIAWASTCYTLYPGDILLTGTPQGVGRTVARDVIDASIERLGPMRFRVEANARTALSTARDHAALST